MTKQYALHQLLKHGPLTKIEMVEITGWDKAQVIRAFKGLREKRMVRRSALFNGWIANG